MHDVMHVLTRLHPCTPVPLTHHDTSYLNTHNASRTPVPGMAEHGWHRRLAHIFSLMDEHTAYYRSNWGIDRDNRNTYYLDENNEFQTEESVLAECVVVGSQRRPYCLTVVCCISCIVSYCAVDAVSQNASASAACLSPPYLAAFWSIFGHRVLLYTVCCTCVAYVAYVCIG